MKYLLLLLLASPSFAITAVQTQDIGGSSVTWSAKETFSGSFVANNLVHISSVARNFPFNQSETTYNVCLATVSITTAATMPLRVWYSGSIGSASGSGMTVGASFLLDGGYDSGLSSTVGIITSFIQNSGNFGHDGSWSWVTMPVAAGTHYACLTSAESGNNTYMCTSVPGISVSCQFGVEAVQ